MIFYTIPYVLAVFLLMLLLHIVALIFHDPVGKILAYVNIGLHIAFLFLLLLAKIPPEEAVLLYMISVTVYFFAGAFSRRFAAGGRGEGISVAPPTKDIAASDEASVTATAPDEASVFAPAPDASITAIASDGSPSAFEGVRAGEDTPPDRSRDGKEGASDDI